MDAFILQAIEKIRCPFLDVFFAVFTALGEEMIIAAIIAVVYICFHKRTGEQALLSVMTASCVTAGIKSAVRRSRRTLRASSTAWTSTTRSFPPPTSTRT